MMILRVVFIFFCVSAVCGSKSEKSATVDEKITLEHPNNNSSTSTEAPVGCTCGIFLFESKKLTKELPEGDPVISHEISEKFSRTPDGHKSCTKKCLSIIIKHLPNSPTLICSALNRDCHKERAHLFIRNGSDKWIRTNLSAGREFCCKNNLPYKC